MTDTVKAWIGQRREVVELDPYSYGGGGEDIERMCAALEKTLELHKPFEWSFGYGPVYSCEECSRLGGNSGKEDEAEWPCATVQAIEGAINE